MVSYAPSIEFLGTNSQVILQRQRVIIESNDGNGKSSQWVSDLAAGEFEKIAALVNKDLEQPTSKP